MHVSLCTYFSLLDNRSRGRLEAHLAAHLPICTIDRTIMLKRETVCFDRTMKNSTASFCLAVFGLELPFLLHLSCLSFPTPQFILTTLMHANSKGDSFRPEQRELSTADHGLACH